MMVDSAWVRRPPALMLMLMLCAGIQVSRGQVDTSYSYSTDQQPLRDRALFLADTWVHHPTFFTKLLDILSAATPIVNIGQNYSNVEFVKEHAIDILETFMNSNDTSTIASILLDELLRVNITDLTSALQKQGLSTQDSGVKQNLTEAIYSRFHTTRALRRILSKQSAMNYLPLTPEDKIYPTCYNNLMYSLDALPGVLVPPTQDLTFLPVPWARHMLDASGKPGTGGLVGGSGSVWAGSSRECGSVQARLVPGLTLGNRTLQHHVNFYTRLCGVSLHLPDSLSALLQGRREEVQWDVCVPDSCSSQQVQAVFNLGVLRSLDLNVTSVSCEGEDSKASSASPVPLVSDDSILKTLHACTGDTVMPSEWISCFKSVFDHNRNGNVSLDEWSALDKRDNSARYFLSLDVNHDLQLDDSDLNYFFHLADDNNNAWLSNKELELAWKTFVWSHPPVLLEDPAHMMTSPILHYMMTSCNLTSASIDIITLTSCFWATFDKNNNGRVSVEEWEETAPRGDDTVRYYKLLDTNTDLVLDSRDLHYLVSLYFQGYEYLDILLNGSLSTSRVRVPRYTTERVSLYFQDSDRLSLFWSPGYPYTRA